MQEAAVRSAEDRNSHVFSAVCLKVKKEGWEIKRGEPVGSPLSCSWADSNRHYWRRRPALYPLSYKGNTVTIKQLLKKSKLKIKDLILAWCRAIRTLLDLGRAWSELIRTWCCAKIKVLMCFC